ncbi:sigma-70 family RNA polymerase sigma factor [Mycobacterium sp. URHB0044]|uniref:sigma-70 family RNA polymerase sigma factor n=1 Tax=Mycobacterium sp. URHB0044 TaxID=1380386 RepID=UPI000687052C|nr:sigma-70 family RNA polymerase sigma factor [Mycobacterium sp. URHB0044]
MTIVDAHRSPDATTRSASDAAIRFETAALPLRAELERAARRYTRSVHDAEDLVQETFTKAWAGFDSFDPGTNLRAWMHRIMVNAWIGSHRRAECRPKESLTDSFTDAQLAGETRLAPSAEVRALQRLPDEDLRHAIGALSAPLQTVIYYADVCELPYKEIARMEGIPVGTVMSRVHRARRQLRATLCDAACLPHNVFHHPDTSMTASAN